MIVALAGARPDLAAELLNRWRKIRSGDLAGLLREVRRIRLATHAGLEAAKKLGSAEEREKAASAHFQILLLQRLLENDIETERKKAKKKSNQGFLAHSFPNLDHPSVSPAFSPAAAAYSPAGTLSPFAGLARPTRTAPPWAAMVMPSSDTSSTSPGAPSPSTRVLA